MYYLFVLFNVEFAYDGEITIPDESVLDTGSAGATKQLTGSQLNPDLVLSNLFVDFLSIDHYIGRLQFRNWC